MDGKVELDVSDGSHTVAKGFDASSLYPERINESDKNALMDFTTTRVIPWVYRTGTIGYERTWREITPPE